MVLASPNLSFTHVFQGPKDLVWFCPQMSHLYRPWKNLTCKKYKVNLFKNPCNCYTRLLITNLFLTLLEIFIFCPKFQLWFPEKIVDFFRVKNSWKCCGFGLFSCWQLWFHEKFFGWKTREIVGDLHFLVVDNFDFPRKIVWK